MRAFQDILPKGREKNIIGMTQEMKAIYLAAYLQETDKSILLVTDTLYESNRFYQMILKYTNDVLLFPMDDFLTSEAVAASPELKNTRLETLNSLLLLDKKIVITNLMGYLRFLPEKSIYEKSIITLSIHKEFNINLLVERLISLGYEKNMLVEKTGDFAARGFVIDIFPIDNEYPIRIEFFGDEIDDIRFFDIETQRAINSINQICIFPNTEFITERFIPDAKHKDLYKYGVVCNIDSYLNIHTIVYDNYSIIKESYQLLCQEILNYNLDQGFSPDTIYMNSLEKLFCDDAIFFEKYDQTIDCVGNTLNIEAYPLEPFKTLSALSSFITNELKENKTIILCVSNRYNLNKLQEHFQDFPLVITNENDIYLKYVNIIIKSISEGFTYLNYTFISEREIFGKEDAPVKFQSKFRYGTKIRNINTLSIGDYIVHSMHGIGKYIGLKSLKKNNIEKDYLVLEYKGGDKLYIPVEKIDTISKYSSNGGAEPQVHKLGGSEWIKTKLRIQKKLEDIAGQLLELYAKRESSQGYSFAECMEDQVTFDKEFPYEETKDQIKVWEEIKKDMESNHPMDRLLCGDVGFGKTEVAFRAMFKAVMSGKQVAYLCPTTILSSQHHSNAIERFKHFAINIELLNRFVTAKEASRIKEEIQNGKVDIVIGTHRILSNDIVFKDLGLLVVDEEQRFGVKQKEKIKQYKNNVDILTLSATPIPRTLQMSMSGLRSLSLIETPPINRYPVQTYVLVENKSVIRDVIYKELSRHGQVFILYNHVDKMEAKAKEISSIVPNARIICANGQMPKRELEDVMFKFIDGEYDILLCTTIIETGIDIPNVNTLLILEADHFGLAQLYQIRGRVGRSNKIAYCYLMYTQGKSLSDVAMKRLDVIKQFTQLGSGFSIAMRDLSIRGAGDILGSEQAGFIDSVGIELYLKMLNEEIQKLKGKVIPESNSSTQPLLDIGTSISDEYVSDTDLKIEIHKKINQIDSYEMLHAVKEEIEDRFGKIDEKMLIYMYEELFERYAEQLHITKVRQTPNFIEIYIPSQLTKKIDGQKLFMETSKLSRMFRFSQKLGQLVVTLDIVKLDKHFIYYLIDFLEILSTSIK